MYKRQVFDYTKQFDGADITANTITVTKEEITQAYDLVDVSLVEIIRKAKENIRIYHEKQKQYSWFDSKPDGTMLGQKVTALQRVGCLLYTSHIFWNCFQIFHTH